jgi:hypothetical protein
MVIMKKFCLFLYVTVFACLSAFAQDDISSQLISYTKRNLPCCGKLKSESGFVYVNVDDRYIHDLIPFLEDLGFEKPPYFGREDLVGAHITVIYPKEMQEYALSAIEEVGKSIAFTPLYCKIVSPPTWKEIDLVYLIVVEAKELDDIRIKYGLPKQKYDYHITIGVKAKDKKAA